MDAALPLRVEVPSGQPMRHWAWNEVDARRCVARARAQSLQNAGKINGNSWQRQRARDAAVLIAEAEAQSNSAVVDVFRARFPRQVVSHPMPMVTKPDDSMSRVDLHPLRILEIQLLDLERDMVRQCLAVWSRTLRLLGSSAGCLEP